MKSEETMNLRWDEKGLIPAIVQDHRTGKVLMLGYMNNEALTETIKTGKVHFFSRKRNKLWMKGEESGNVLIVKNILFDCDEDTLLVLAEPKGPTCHTGETSCFYRSINNEVKPAPYEIIDELYKVIEERKNNPSENSYTSTLFQKGIEKIAKKVLEEAGEVTIASLKEDKSEIIYECADLIYHLLVLTSWFGIDPYEIKEELLKRFGKSGLRSKNED